MKAYRKRSPKRSHRNPVKLPPFVKIGRTGRVHFDPEKALVWLSGRDRGERRSLLELGALTAACVLWAPDKSRRQNPAESFIDAMVVAAATAEHRQDRKYLREFLSREVWR